MKIINILIINSKTFIILNLLIDFAFNESINFTELKSIVLNFLLLSKWNIKGIAEIGKSHKNGERKNSILNR